MKRMKWICRYGFLGLLLAGCAGWGVYCQVAVSNLKKTADSLAFIDMAVSRPKEAVALLERINKFTALRNWGFILAGVMLLCIGLMVTFQIVYPKMQAKAPKAPKAPKPPKAPKVKPVKKSAPVAAPAPAPAAEPVPAPQPVVVPQPEPAPAPEPAPKPVFCHQCGTRYEEKPPFCGNCGAKL